MAQRDYPHIAVEDYLLIDEQSTYARYEYLDGELRILAGGSPRHCESDGWKFRAYGPDSIVKVESLDISFPIDDIYQGMNLTVKRVKK